MSSSTCVPAENGPLVGEPSTVGVLSVTSVLPKAVGVFKLSLSFKLSPTDSVFELFNDTTGLLCPARPRNDGTESFASTDEALVDGPGNDTSFPDCIGILVDELIN